MIKNKKMKATWINKDGNKVIVEAPDNDIEKLKKKVDYYNRKNNKVKYE